MTFVLKFMEPIKQVFGNERERGKSNMKFKYISRFIIVMMFFCSTVFAVINDGSNDYIEKLLPQNFGGATTIRFVVMGTDLLLTSNSSGSNNTTTFTINGTSYIGVTDSVTVSADERYYVYFVPKGNNSATITLTGDDDWTTQTYTSKDVPFSQGGSGSYFFSTTDPIESVVTSNMDFFLINNVLYADGTTAKMSGTNYFYYGTTNSEGSLEVKEYKPVLNIKVFVEGALW